MKREEEKKKRRRKEEKKIEIKAKVHAGNSWQKSFKDELNRIE